MDASRRRVRILDYLRAAKAPVSATALAKKLSVSRQIIVGDVALLRAGGEDITATPRGYVLDRPRPGLTRTVACLHSGADMERELTLMVDQGCAVENVIVEHPVYGGQLSVESYEMKPPRGHEGDRKGISVRSYQRRQRCAGKTHRKAFQA